MADIKRPNYFTSQFLVEKDFDDEQAYHLGARRRHNRVLHTAGVADGLGVTWVSATQVRVDAGTAVDRDGRELVLAEARTYALATAGSGLDVYLTLAYEEVLDAADRYTLSGLDEFTRTTERPVLRDGAAVPPNDGSVVVLARIRLNGAGQIDPAGAIDTAVRTIASARIAPQGVGNTQLADGAVTLAKLADEVKPLAVQGANAITVVTDNTLKRITVGESHSARVDNPHATTAAQIDNQGGANGIVTQINAGTGIIARSRVGSAIVSGTVTFQNVAAGVEMFSDAIDPGFGPGAVSVELAIEDVPGAGLTSKGRPTSANDTSTAHAVVFRSQVNRTTGRFLIHVTRNAGSPTESVTVRWTAFKPTTVASATVAVGVTVSPSSATVISNQTRTFTAAVTNTSTGGVTWSISELNGGTLSGTTATATTYSPPGVSGTYHLVATSVADPTKSATVAIVVNADVTVSLNQAAATVFRGATLNLTATVINTNNTGVTWSIQQGATGGALSSTTATATTYTAPLTPGTYIVTATSVANNSKTASCTITVPAVTVTLNTASATVFRGGTLSLIATVGNATNTGVTWSIQEGSSGGSVSPTTGGTTTYTAPLNPGTYHVTATSAADTSKTASCTITVPAVTISIAPDSGTVSAGSSTIVRATITGTNDNRANWAVGQTVTGLSVSPSIGPTTTFNAPGVGGTFTVTASAVADTSKSTSTSIVVPIVGGGGGGKFTAAEENIATSMAMPTSEPAPLPEEDSDASATARAFVRPKKRPSRKRPPEPNDE